MKPERNLMAACGLEDETQCVCIATLTDMMDEGPKVILRLQEIRRGVIIHPEPLTWYRQKQIEFEMLNLFTFNAVLNGLDNYVLDQVYNRITKIVRDVCEYLSIDGRDELIFFQVFVAMMF
ncbi:hypothetical protein DPMN_037895 [Dreissena polymorpha]|uniref:Uncharacterized protein n=1 Tax=Dreissena polymorpha TaxID=45954 RepID=A0A9D4MFB5_DREPO|nr:hypothetical protein DPMN_037895 [Dreissena polymorpha]